MGSSSVISVAISATFVSVFILNTMKLNYVFLILLLHHCTSTMEKRGPYKKYVKCGNDVHIPRTSQWKYESQESFEAEGSQSQVDGPNLAKRLKIDQRTVNDDTSDEGNFCEEQDTNGSSMAFSDHPQADPLHDQLDDALHDEQDDALHDEQDGALHDDQDDALHDELHELQGFDGLMQYAHPEESSPLPPARERTTSICSSSESSVGTEPTSTTRPQPYLSEDDPTVELLNNLRDFVSMSNQPHCGVDTSPSPASQGDLDEMTEVILTIDEFVSEADLAQSDAVHTDQCNILNLDETDKNASKPPHHKELKKALQSENFTSPIATTVNASPAEALLMTLALAEQNNLSFKAFADTARLLNSLFSSPVIAETQYLLDKLLIAESGIERFFYCNKCTRSLGKIDHKKNPEVICPGKKCKTVNYIKDLTKATYFVLYSVEPQIELLLKNDEIKSSLRNPKDLIQESEDGKLKDLYDGSSYKNFVESLHHTLCDLIISFTICTDGSPLFKSSAFSIWPVFLCINELPPSLRMKNLLLVGLWFGPKHPPMDLFLEPIVKHLKVLSDLGFKVLIKDVEIKIKAYTVNCCVDSGARGAVQGINSHSGYFSCNWCEIPGAYVENRVVFPFEEIPSKLRTHQELQKQALQCMKDNKLFYVYGAQYISPLAILPGFDLVQGMAQDFLHNIPFGIGRVFLDHWLTKTKRSFYIGSPDDLDAMNMKIRSITPCIEVRRAVRSLSVRSYWNAREYENWIVFFSFPVLSGILKPKFLNHWMCLVQAVYLLSRRSVSNSDVNIGHKLLIYFVAKVEEIYGQKYMTFNVHILTHLAQHVARWGPTWAISTFCFESAIGTLKSLLHAQRGVPHQVQRAISYKEAKSILMENCNTPKVVRFFENIVPKPNKMTVYMPLNECVAIGKSVPFVPSKEEEYLVTKSGYDINISNCTVYSKIIASKCVYITENIAVGKCFNNSVALLLSGEIVSIKKFIVDRDSEKTYVFCVSVCTESFLKFPQNVKLASKDHCLRKIVSIGRRLMLQSVLNLDIVCVKTTIGNKSYVTPMHNLHNVC